MDDAKQYLYGENILQVISKLRFWGCVRRLRRRTHLQPTNFEMSSNFSGQALICLP